jgi:hypothetical protein
MATTQVMTRQRAGNRGTVLRQQSPFLNAGT